MSNCGASSSPTSTANSALNFSWYGLWSLITGLTVYSHSQIFYDVCRAMQGIGPATLLPNAVAILGRTYPQGRRKNMIFSLFGATAPWGFIIGAGFSSVLAQLAWWPWAYWCLTIACCLAAAVAYFIIPSQADDGVMDKSMDYLGSVTGVSGLVLLNVAWNVSVLSIISFYPVSGFQESVFEIPEILLNDTIFRICESAERVQLLTSQPYSKHQLLAGVRHTSTSYS